MPYPKRGRLSRARALLARLSFLHKHNDNRNYRYEHAALWQDKEVSISPLSTPPTEEKVWQDRHDEDRSMPKIIRESIRMIPRGRTARAVSDMHMDNEAMRKRLAELEMIEMENSSLRLQVDDLQRALEDTVEERKDVVQVGEMQMADIENSSLRLQVDCLREQLQRNYYGNCDVVERRLRWLNVDAVC